MCSVVPYERLESLWWSVMHLSFLRFMAHHLIRTPLTVGPQHWEQHNQAAVAALSYLVLVSEHDDSGIIPEIQGAGYSSHFSNGSFRGRPNCYPTHRPSSPV